MSGNCSRQLISLTVDRIEKLLILIEGLIFDEHHQIVKIPIFDRKPKPVNTNGDRFLKKSEIIMLWFFKKVGESSSSETPKTTNVEETIAKDNEQETPLKYIKVDLDSLPADPGQRPSMEVYHVNQKDEIEDITCKRDLVNLEIIRSNEERLEVEFVNSIILGLMIINIGGVDNFVKGGFKAWNKRERLDIHSNGGPHNLAQTNSQKDKNRIKIYASIDCVRFLLRQGLPFRGHNEGGDSRNKGNFLELLHFYAERNDKVGNVVLRNAPRNSQMKSSSIQKDFVRACAIETLKVIRKEIGDSFFSILVDESRDVSCKEQMALVLRFVNDKGLVVERFIGIKHLLFIQCFQTMSCVFLKFEVKVMTELLALVFVAKNHHDINDFFELTSRLLNMIGSSYKCRDKLRDKQATRVVEALAHGDLESGTSLNQEIGIKRPSDTRWGSHYGSLLNIKTLYPSICEVLEDIMEDANSQDHRSEASRMLKSFLTFDFVFCLHLMVDILGITNELNTTLQRKDQDIINAMHQVRASKERLQETKNEGWQPLLSSITSFCNKYDVEILNMEHPYYNGISRRKGSKVSNSNHYQVDVFYSVIDMQIQELNNRFTEANTTLLLSIASLCPRQCFKSFQVDEIMKMAEFYPVEFPSTELEALRGQLQNYIKDVRGDARFNDLKGLGDLAKQMVETSKHQIYPKVYVLLKLALTLPVATSTVERAFSAMKLIKSDLRNKMGDDFMSNCLISYIENDVSDSISNDTILENF
ncbi:hypothetical protein OSB04_001438 [Centaurea solstitialis]|uniref:Uncharacterized protein n=1 Tax=Centaurea solstitialis TaxID=347529 RepID=A0AA38WLF3_9ASTR|nr:hypothetical protein OSB04_001438 [Centaurea solstitialis]